MHHVVAPDVCLGVALDALRGDAACADAHADAEVVGGRDGEGGQATHDNLVLALFEGQTVFYVGRLATGIGCRICGVVDGPDGNALASHAEILERLPGAAAAGVAGAGKIDVAFVEDFPLGIIDLACRSGVRHTELRAGGAGIGRLVHHAVPLAACCLVVEDVREIDDVAVAGAGQSCVVHGAGMVAQPRVPVAELGAVGLQVLPCRGKDGVCEKLEVGILKPLRDAFLERADMGGKRLVVLDALLHLGYRQRDVIDAFGLAGRRKAIVLESQIAHFIGKFLAEGLGRPPTAELVSTLGRPLADVPGQLHAELELCLCRLDVADVYHPESRHAVFVGFRQLVADERG